MRELTCEEVEREALATLSPAKLAAFRSYQRRGVYIEHRPDPGFKLENLCYAWAKAKERPWVRVRHRRKYSSITVDLLSSAPPRMLDNETFEHCYRIVAGEGKPGTGFCGGPACFFVESIPIHRAGNVADLLYAVAQRRTE